MKKVLLISILAFGVLFIACDKQKALDSIMADPETKSYLLNQMLTDEMTRAQLADSIFNDEAVVNAFLAKMAENEQGRTQMFDHIMDVDTTGEWITGKLVENSDIKKLMKKVSK